jgi:uncharacterized membrane protein
MENWLLLGLLAAVVYALSGLASKVALNHKYMGVEPALAGLYTALGVTVVFMVYYVYTKGFTLPKQDLGGIISSVAVGFFWALGVIFVYTALMRHADISKMAPIYNMNTLIVVLLGIILLKELPDKTQALRVFIGAVLIVVGGILVSV